MKALTRMALILTPLLVAPTGRFAAGVARVPQHPGIPLILESADNFAAAHRLWFRRW